VHAGASSGSTAALLSGSWLWPALKTGTCCWHSHKQQSHVHGSIGHGREFLMQSNMNLSCSLPGMFRPGLNTRLSIFLTIRSSPSRRSSADSTEELFLLTASDVPAGPGAQHLNGDKPPLPQEILRQGLNARLSLAGPHN
jgi:hypothetical protein